MSLDQKLEKAVKRCLHPILVVYRLNDLEKHKPFLLNYSFFGRVFP